jgi:ribosomal protein L37AE/L43A
MSGTPVTSLVRTLDQELLALTRGASLECPVCSEFVLHVATRDAAGTVIACPECRSILADGVEAPQVHLPHAWADAATGGESGP